jgi:putative spermidine/putrescine transport system permease protein
MTLVAGPLLFLVFLFIIPIGNMLVRSVDDSLINRVLPITLENFEAWDKTSEPPEILYASIVDDLRNIERTDMGKVSTRMNYAKPGWKSLVKRTARKLKKIKEGPYKEALIKIDERWADKEFWLSLGIMKDKRTFGYFLNSVDKTYDFDKNIISVKEEQRVYNLLWYRTLMVSFIVTIACLILSYPVSYLLATLPMRISNLLMICVLMPSMTIIDWR